MGKKVEELLKIISELPCSQKQVEKEKQKLYNYLKNNETRINYGLFKEKGLLFGSGAVLLSIYTTCRLRNISFTDFLHQSLKHNMRFGKPMLIKEYIQKKETLAMAA